MMASAFANLIGTGNYQSLRETLTDNPALANTGIPCSDDDPRLGHIEQGADIFYAGGDGAAALHWGAFCGKDKLVAALIAKGAKIDQPDTTFIPRL
jgi:hypothetical protein